MLTMKEIRRVRSPLYPILRLVITWASTSPFAHVYLATERFKRRELYEYNHTTLEKRGPNTGHDEAQVWLET